MELISVRDLFKNTEKYADREVEVGGWVRSIRDMKSCGFVTINDGSCFRDLQVVMSRESFAGSWRSFRAMPPARPAGAGRSLKPRAAAPWRNCCERATRQIELQVIQNETDKNHRTGFPVRWLDLYRWLNL